VGLGTVGATVIGMSKLAELQRQAAPGREISGRSSAPSHLSPSSSASSLSAATPASPAPARVTLGVEAVDADKPGALVVGVHVPGPGYTAGLVRGDVLLAFGKTRIDSAADLARAVAEASAGTEVTLTIRHQGGVYQQLTAVPGVVT